MFERESESVFQEQRKELNACSTGLRNTLGKGTYRYFIVSNSLSWQPGVCTEGEKESLARTFSWSASHVAWLVRGSCEVLQSHCTLTERIKPNKILKSRAKYGLVKNSFYFNLLIKYILLMHEKRGEGGLHVLHLNNRYW